MPKWDPIRLSVAGYQSGKTDFSERIAAFSNEGQQKYESFLAWVASVALTPGAVAFVQVRGYSDRQDAENMTATQRRNVHTGAVAFDLHLHIRVNDAFHRYQNFQFHSFR